MSLNETLWSYQTNIHIVGGGALDAPHFPPQQFQRGVEGAAPYDSNFIFYEMV